MPLNESPLDDSRPSAPHPSSPEWLRRAFAEISAAHSTTDGGPEQRQDDVRAASDWPPTALAAPKFPPSSEAEQPDPRQLGGGGESNMFDAVWPSARRRPVEAPIENRSEERRERPSKRSPEAASRFAESQPAAIAAPPGRPVAGSAPPPQSQSILKSGVIDEMAYTLFTDGSIEAQMPDGTMRFASIDELRRHLDTQSG